jgi:hypothetical protein
MKNFCKRNFRISEFQNFRISEFKKLRVLFLLIVAPVTIISGQTKFTGIIATANCNSSGHTADLATDASSTTYWEANNTNTGNWLTLDLGSKKYITYLNINSIGGGYTLKLSNNNTTWSQVSSGTLSSGNVQLNINSAIAYQYIMLTSTTHLNQYSDKVYNFEAYGFTELEEGAFTNITVAGNLKFGYGGGFYSNDATWIRTYGNKSFYQNTGIMRTDGQLQVGNEGARFLVNSDGNVGIGTTSVSNAKLTVKGKILAEEFQIVTDANSPNSDFVFEQDYKLRSLTEVEQFVKQNKHLPEIPSAKEFKENGYKVAQMDDLLLRKVEELTLYTIELNKQVEALKAELAKVKGGE